MTSSTKRIEEEEALRNNASRIATSVLSNPHQEEVSLLSKDEGTKNRKKKSNSTSKHKKGGEKDVEKGSLYLFFKWTIVGMLLALGSGQFIAGDIFWGYRGKYIKKATYLPPDSNILTVKDLAQYDGTDPKKPIYLSIMGKVYDVTAGKRIYGPGGSYSFFSGKDASRAYVTGCFETHLTHDLRGLKMQELQQIGMWKAFFDNHPQYFQVGVSKLDPIDPNSPPPLPCEENKESFNPSEL